jgi:hypothetical protein
VASASSDASRVRQRIGQREAGDGFVARAKRERQGDWRREAAMSALAHESYEVLHACSIDETQQGVYFGGEPAPLGVTWCELPLHLWSITRFALTAWRARPLYMGDRYEGLDKFRCLFIYACQYPSRRKRTPMNVDAMVERWVPIIRGLATGHDKATIDRCEFEMEQHIMPMLSAPVAQLRKFYSALCAALKADTTIPLFVWTMFESWGEAILKNAPDGEIVTLKKKLAADIADMVEKDVHADLREALIGALQWRSGSQLQAVKAEIEKGETKPRLRGRESCLFLVAGEGTPNQVEVML